MSKHRFSIIIVNYNGGRFLQKALDSLAKQTFQDFEVIVIDNASQDGSAEALDTSALPGSRVFMESENHGFAKANNMAARMADSDWLALLNPDAVATPGWLEAIEAGISRHDGIKMFACLQRSLENPDILDGTGDAYFGFGIPWRGGFGRPASEIPPEGTCFSPCGASAVYERDTFLAHGGFDECFFCFGEDTDLAFRMRLAGETCVFLPSAEIAHEGGGVSGRASHFSIWHGARNRVWTYVKNMPDWSFWVILPFHAGFTVLILLRGLMTGRFVSTWKGLVAGVKGLGPIWQKRRKLQAGRTVPPEQVLSAMSWSPLRLLMRKSDVRPIS